MSKYIKTLDDPEFDQLVPLREAYRIMERFTVAYLERGDTSIIEFLAYFGVDEKNTSSDPAALNDFLDATKNLRSPN